MSIFKTFWYWLTGQDVLRDYEQRAEHVKEAGQRYLETRERDQ